MKTLLIDPPYDCLMGIKAPTIYPLGLAYLSAVLNRAGHESVYINLDYDGTLMYANPFSRVRNISFYKKYLEECDKDLDCEIWKKLKDLIVWMSPEIVGISCVTVKMRSVLRVARIIKSYSSDIKVVLGGHHSQIYANEIVNNCLDVDFIIKGEGEESFVELADLLEKQKFENRSNLEDSLKNIDGLVFRDNLGKACENKPRSFISNLDSLPCAESAKYYENGKLIDIPLSSIMTSRGCPYDCSYCATNQIWQRVVRRRSLENVVEEIEYRVLTANIYEFIFFDDCFTMNKNWIAEFCNLLLKKNISINWSCISSANLVDESLFELIVRAGCNKINLGIESGSERILELCNKRLDLSYAKKIFNYSDRLRVSTTAYFMIGFPTETEADIRKTHELISELRPNWVYLNVWIPLPGTKFFDWAVGEGLIDVKSAWSGDIYEHLQCNYTRAVSDELFDRLVDENYALCYKINKRMSNILKRVPFRAYTRRPSKAISDIIKLAYWIRK